MNGIKTDKLLVVTGATATGKTRLAVELAALFDGEIISADSRQVYKGMDIGTGKDLSEYNHAVRPIPFHLIDIHEPGHEYNIHDFGNDFRRAKQEIENHHHLPILCGGSGLYVEAALRGLATVKVETNLPLRRELEKLSIEKLIHRFRELRNPHNTTDLTDRNRLIRAIEIADSPRQTTEKSPIPHLIIGLRKERSVLRESITRRLRARLDNGMVDEVKNLLDKGVSPESLIFYGLEYKYITLFLIGQLPYLKAIELLNTAIHQFAKRQETWFRRMERQGFTIHWIDASLPFSEVVEEAVFTVKTYL